MRIEEFQNDQNEDSDDDDSKKEEVDEEVIDDNDDDLRSVVDSSFFPWKKKSMKENDTIFNVCVDYCSCCDYYQCPTTRLLPMWETAQENDYEYSDNEEEDDDEEEDEEEDGNRVITQQRI